MAKRSPNDQSWRERVVMAWETVVRAFREFLLVPTLIIFGFFLLALLTDWLDRTTPLGLAGVRDFLARHFFSDARGTGNLLGYIAGGLVTVTSITASVLLVAVQQSASTLTARVFDQFLRRRLNQIYFGLFVGLALFALIILTTTSQSFNPVFGGTVAFLMTALALYLLIVLIYSTIDQMRPDVIVAAIHDHALTARKHELTLVRRTRRTATRSGPHVQAARSGWSGYVTRIDLNRLAAGLRDCSGDVEVELLVLLGSFVGYCDVVAQVRGEREDELERLAHLVPRCLRLEQQRDVKVDPSYAIEELEMVAWTSISTAKSNPEPGLITIRSLRDILARWSAPEERDRPHDVLPVVYLDGTVDRLLGAFESLGIVASESLQHQSLAEVLTVFVVMFSRLPPTEQDRVESIILRLLSSAGDHVLSRELELAFRQLTAVLEENHRPESAARVGRVLDELRSTVGRLASRGDRAKVGREG